MWLFARSVSENYIGHMKSRVELICFTHPFVHAGGSVAKEAVAECGRCLAKWIVDACAAHDANEGLRALPLLPEIEDAGINNLNLFLDQAKVPKRLRLAIAKDLNALGAVDVNEVSQADWDALPTWPLLKTCERRRILAQVPRAS